MRYYGCQPLSRVTLLGICYVDSTFAVRGVREATAVEMEPHSALRQFSPPMSLTLNGLYTRN